MTAPSMHADEVDIDASLVRRLLAAQFPHWAQLPLERVASSGTDNAIFRLGDQLAVRMPRRPGATAQIEKEARWLPVLAPHLSLAVPVPLATGDPGEDYAWQWSVVPWMPGEAWTAQGVSDLDEAAADLARFITTLQRVDATEGPRPGPKNFYRGAPLSVLDANMGTAVAAAADMVDADAITAVWDAALRAPPYEGAPVWVHGDLSRPGNLIVNGGRLTAVIDFGCLGVGDPACEAAAAWSLFSGESRRTFRDALSFDDATWARARGWAVRAVGAIPYYRDTNPAIVAEALHTIKEALSDIASS